MATRLAPRPGSRRDGEDAVAELRRVTRDAGAGPLSARPLPSNGRSDRGDTDIRSGVKRSRCWCSADGCTSRRARDEVVLRRMHHQETADDGLHQDRIAWSRDR